MRKLALPSSRRRQRGVAGAPRAGSSSARVAAAPVPGRPSFPTWAPAPGFPGLSWASAGRSAGKCARRPAWVRGRPLPSPPGPRVPVLPSALRPPLGAPAPPSARLPFPSQFCAFSLLWVGDRFCGERLSYFFRSGPHPASMEVALEILVVFPIALEILH